MAQEIADSKLIDTWSSDGLKVKPDISKIIEGWQLGEQPPHEYMNWLQNTFGSKLNHILKNGVASWNNTTQYLAGSSVQHSGNVWLCKTTNTNSGPTDANANWKRIITVESLTTVLAGYVDTTSTQTIAGVKTFSSNPLSTATQSTNTNALTKYSAVVKNSGDETIAGVKTFSSSPIVPTPKTDFQATTARSTSITVNVGTGQTYTTINQALEYLSGFYPLHKTTGVAATINLKAGFVMNEQVLVGGLNLGWITIVGEDASTVINHNALTNPYADSVPAFGAISNATLPIINQLFNFNVEKVGGNKDGVSVVSSKVIILPGKGFVGAGRHGVYGSQGASIIANGAVFSRAGSNGINAYGGTVVSAADCTCGGCSNDGISINGASFANVQGATVNNSGRYGILSNQGSVVNAKNASITNQTTGTCVFVVDGSTINAKDITTTGSTATVLNQAANTLTVNGIIYR